MTEPNVVHTIPMSATFTSEVPVTGQDTAYRERNTTYFNGVPIQNLLPANMPQYNFYNISNVPESDIVENR